jgi:hypothetical protein
MIADAPKLSAKRCILIEAFELCGCGHRHSGRDQGQR